MRYFIKTTYYQFIVETGSEFEGTQNGEKKVLSKITLIDSKYENLIDEWKISYDNTKDKEITKGYFVARNKNTKNNKLFSIGVRAVQKQLKIVCNYLGLENISTHSFRKLYGVTVYENNDSNIYLLKEILNHSSIATTQRYIRVSQQAINKASQEINFII